MQTLALYLPFALLGLAVGSFLNVLTLRTMAGRSCGGRSACMHCGRTLAWYELVPLVSYLVLWGKCRTCGARLSVQYPLVEALTAAVFLGVGVRLCGAGVCDFGAFAALDSLPVLAVPALFATHLAAWAGLIAIFVYDLRTTYIPDTFSYTTAGCALVAQVLAYYMAPVAPGAALLHTLLAGPLLFAPFFLLWKLSGGRWMGLGDAKLAWAMGWLLGIGGGFSAVMFGFWLGALVALALLAVQRFFGPESAQRVAAHDAASSTPAPEEGAVEECACSPSPVERVDGSFSPRSPLTLTSEIPFGPFLVTGTAIVYFTGVTYGSLFGLDGTLFAALFGL